MILDCHSSLFLVLFFLSLLLLLLLLLVLLQLLHSYFVALGFLAFTLRLQGFRVWGLGIRV